MKETSVWAIPRMILLFLQGMRMKAACVVTLLTLVAASNWTVGKSKLAIEEIPDLP